MTGKKMICHERLEEIEDRLKAAEAKALVTCTLKEAFLK
jgi:uncharacterized protein YlzI (FlbEa/FlbD family)